MGDLALDQDQHYVHSHLTRAEDRLPPLKNSNVVYRIPCACGKMYIGETIRRYGMHVDELASLMSRIAIKVLVLPRSQGILGIVSPPSTLTMGVHTCTLFPS